MSAETLNCPMCGAAAETDAAQCLYCRARLATVSCPACFGMMFMGSRHCPRCGARAARTAGEVNEARLCPRCQVSMKAVSVGHACLNECERCSGLWIDAAAFEEICADREQQAAVLGAPTLQKQPVVAGGATSVRYVPCPQCQQLMNRTNFARCSGVVIDVCKGHGTWFDAEELQRIVEFIRAGGMSTARTREIEQLAEERRRLRQEQLAAAARNDARLGWRDGESNQLSAGVAVGELLNLFFD